MLEAHSTHKIGHTYIQKSSLERLVLEDYTEDLTGEAGVGRLYRSPHWLGWCWKTVQKTSLERLVLEDCTEDLTGEDGVGRLYRRPHWRG